MERKELFSIKMSISLAFVIPAYKGRFLKDTLNSLAGQTCGKFNVYIGDDASPDDLASIVEPYRQQLSLHYKKFETNLGKESLTAHWARVIDMVQGEKWIWLLPDDDMIGEDCVETFLQHASGDIEQERLYRFQSFHIDEDNKVIKKLPPCPPLETNVEFVIRKLRFERSSSVAEYIFSKKQYMLAGGFIQLPLAWGSDDFMWVRLAQKYPIITLPGGLVYLRQSSLNISNNKYDYTEQKFEAKYLFLKKLLSNALFMEKLEQSNSANEFRNAIKTHLFYEYKSYDFDFRNRNLFKYARLNKEVIGGGILKNIYRLIRHQLKNG